MDIGTSIPASALPTLTIPAAGKISAVVDKKLHAAARDYESVFLNEMVKHMSDGLQYEGAGEGGSGEAMFRNLLNEQYSNAISKAGGIGLAQPLYQEMLKMQEASSHAR